MGKSKLGNYCGTPTGEGGRKTGKKKSVKKGNCLKTVLKDKSPADTEWEGDIRAEILRLGPLKSSNSL